MIQKMKMKILRVKFFHGHVLLGKLPVDLFFCFLSAHVFERNSEKTKTVRPGNSTTENAYFDENMKIGENCLREAHLQNDMSKKIIQLEHV